VRPAFLYIQVHRQQTDTDLSHPEGLHDLRIDESLAPTREALSSAFAAGSSSLFKAFDGVRNEVSSRIQDVEKARRERQASAVAVNTTTKGTGSGNWPSNPNSNPQLANITATLGGIGTGIGSFFGSRVASFRGAKGGNGSGQQHTQQQSSQHQPQYGNQDKEKDGAVHDSRAQGQGLRPLSLSSSASSGSVKGGVGRG
jgi:hypothetical protein